MADQAILLPDLVGRQAEADKQLLTLTLRVPEDLFYFNGHFDAAKILPGVVQIDWAVHFGRQYYALVGEFKKLEVIKFQQVIVPNNHIDLQLANRPDQRKLYFAYYLAGQKVSSGRIVFGETKNGI